MIANRTNDLNYIKFMLYYLSYQKIFTLVLFLFFLTIFSINKQLSLVYYLMVLLGIFAITSGKVKFSDIPDGATYYLYCIFTLIALITLSAFLYNPDSLIKYRFAMYRDLVLLPFVILAFMASRIDFEKVLKILVASTLITIFWVIMILIENPVRGSGWLAVPIERGNTGMLAGMICLTALVYFKSWRWKIIAAVGFFSGVGLSILSGSRGGWFAMLIVIPTLLYHLLIANRGAIKYVIGIVVVFLFTVILAWDYLPLSKRIDQTLNALQLYFSGDSRITSLGSRFELWRVSMAGFLERPIFGWGWYNFKQVLIDYQVRSGGQVNVLRVMGNPHNQYLAYLVEMGLVGFISFMVYLIYPLQYFVRKFYLSEKSLQGNNIWPICLLLIVTYEVIMEFCMSDGTLVQKSFLYFITLVTAFSFILLKKEEDSLLKQGYA